MTIFKFIQTLTIGVGAALAFATGAAMAGHVVQIDVKGYSRSYMIGHAGFRGNQTLNLAPGTYSLSNGAGAFSFSVDAGGTVSSHQSASAVGIGNTLELRVGEVTVDPDQYVRTYEFAGGSHFRGVSKVPVILGLKDRITTNGSSEVLSFELSESGLIRMPSSYPVEERVAIEGAGIRFRNVQLSINPNQYEAGYELAGGSWFRGNTTFVSIPGVADSIGNSSHVTIVKFVAAQDGLIKVLSDERSVAVSQARISFQNVWIQVDAADYPRYIGFTARSKMKGKAMQVMVPEVAEKLENDSWSVIGRVRASTEGEVTLLSGSQSMESVPGGLRLKTLAMKIEPKDPVARYSLGDTSKAGTVVERVIPFVREKFEAYGVREGIYVTLDAVAVRGTLSNPNRLIDSSVDFTFSLPLENMPPIVVIESPISGAFVSEGDALSVKGIDQNLARLECFRGSESLGSTAEAQFRTQLKDSSGEASEIRCVATDLAGLVAEVVIQVRHPRYFMRVTPDTLVLDSRSSEPTLAVHVRNVDGSPIEIMDFENLKLVVPGSGSVALDPSTVRGEGVLRFNRERLVEELLSSEVQWNVSSEVRLSLHSENRIVASDTVRVLIPQAKGARGEAGSEVISTGCATSAHAGERGARSRGSLANTLGGILSSPLTFAVLALLWRKRRRLVSLTQSIGPEQISASA